MSAFRKYLSHIADRLSAWRERYHFAVEFCMVAAFVIGLLTGAAAALLKTLIGLIMSWCTGHFGLTHGNYLLLGLPIIGIFLAWLLARYFVHQPMDHASDKIQDDVAKQDFKLSPRLIPGTVVGCALTLGMGGSAGGEDPIAYTGAAIGSNVGRAFRVDTDDMAMLVGCGAAAGIAGIFMAPIGGVMFALEVLKMKSSLRSILAVILASLTAALTCFILMGCNFDVTFVPEVRFELHLIPFVILCGIACGIYSAYYRLVMTSMYGVYRSIKLRPWIKPLIGGITVAALLFVFPSLYGEGYDSISRLMSMDSLALMANSPLYDLCKEHSWVLIVCLGAVAMVKPFATSATNDTGGVGGDFTPTFFAGAIIGFLFAVLMNDAFGLHLSMPLFAFFGMAAVMAAAVEAPLMAIFITAEMTGMEGFLLPLAIAAAASYITIVSLAGIKFSRANFISRLTRQADPR